MENWALVDPAAADTELGMLREPAPVSCRAILNPPAGAAADRVILQVEDVCEVSTVELHPKPVRVTTTGGGGASVSEKFWEIPFSVVTSTAVVVVFTAGAFAVKPAELEPAGTRIDDGMETVDPEARPVATISPPVGAGEDNVTVQAAEPGVVIVAGEQTSPVTVYGEAILT